MLNLWPKNFLLHKLMHKELFVPRLIKAMYFKLGIAILPEFLILSRTQFFIKKSENINHKTL